MIISLNILTEETDTYPSNERHRSLKNSEENCHSWQPSLLSQDTTDNRDCETIHCQCDDQKDNIQ